MIQDQDISVVIQGPVLLKSGNGVFPEITKTICQQIRQLFPKSEIILSTWYGENTVGIDYDSLILSDDPGATWFNYENYDLLNNCNRLLVSTKAGINAATRKYVLKLRSDLFLFSKSFLSFFAKYSDFDHHYKFVEDRIIAFGIYSIKGHRTSLFTMLRPFHISDWAYFGYKEDLHNLYDIPLIKDPEFSQWFLNRCKPFFDIEPHRLWKMPPEQYVTVSFLKRFIDINLEHTTDLSNNNVLISEKLLVNNFIVLDRSQFQLFSLKYFNLQIAFKSLLNRTAIFFHTWLKDYSKFSLQKNIYKKFYYSIISLIRLSIFRGINLIVRSFEKELGKILISIIKNKQKNI